MQIHQNGPFHKLIRFLFMSSSISCDIITAQTHMVILEASLVQPLQQKKRKKYQYLIYQLFVTINLIMDLKRHL